MRLLATSREALHVAAERVYPIAPLGLPDPRAPDDSAEITRSPAVALFVERARAVDPSFEITAANAAKVAAICTRLDGLPLALELAAARVASLSPDAILARLREPLKLLKGGHRDSPDRHRALERTLAWSHDLLGNDERRLFACLGVFSGGFSLEAAEAVCGADLDTLSSLVDKSVMSGDEAIVRDRLADCALIHGDPATAATHYTRSLAAAARSGDRIETCYELQGVAMASAGMGQPERALRIAGAADAQFRSMGHQFVVRFWTALLDRYLGQARAALGAEADAAWQAGHRLSFEAAVAEASASPSPC